MKRKNTLVTTLKSFLMVLLLTLILKPGYTQISEETRLLYKYKKGSKVLGFSLNFNSLENRYNRSNRVPYISYGYFINNNLQVSLKANGDFDSELERTLSYDAGLLARQYFGKRILKPYAEVSSGYSGSTYFWNVKRSEGNVYGEIGGGGNVYLNKYVNLQLGLYKRAYLNDGLGLTPNVRFKVNVIL